MIPVRNIYYMLSYAFRALSSAGYRKLAAEQFDHAADLLAEILARGIAQQARKGFARSYVSRRELTANPRGKIDLTASLRTASPARRQLICEHDELSINNHFNRVLKTAVEMLALQDIDPKRKRTLVRLLPYLKDADRLNPRRIDWRIHHETPTQTYRMLMSISRLAIEGCLQCESENGAVMEDFIDDQRLSALYEHFLLEYFRREHGNRVHAHAPYIAWALDNGIDNALPRMRSDVTLQDLEGSSGRTLIIDAKYYGHNMQHWFGKRSVISGNLYQLFSYVKNEAALHHQPSEVSGMLLYAATDDAVQPSSTYQMSGNTISVRTLDLNKDFKEISAQLDAIVVEYFPRINA